MLYNLCNLQKWKLFNSVSFPRDNATILMQMVVTVGGGDDHRVSLCLRADPWHCLVDINNLEWVES